jgi:phosphotransferase system IIB component
MNLLLSSTGILPYIIMIGIILIVLISIVIIAMKLKNRQPALDENYLKSILDALGSKNNIKKVNLEHQRIQINVLDTKQIDAQFFTTAKIPAFISGNKITVLFKEHTKEIYSFLISKGA